MLAQMPLQIYWPRGTGLGSVAWRVARGWLYTPTNERLKQMINNVYTKFIYTYLQVLLSQNHTYMHGPVGTETTHAETLYLTRTSIQASTRTSYIDTEHSIPTRRALGPDYIFSKPETKIEYNKPGVLQPACGQTSQSANSKPMAP
jgi:hypothetical protein